MNRWMTALVVAAGGAALIAMSAAQAAEFTPTPSTTAAVPAPEGDSAPTEPRYWLEAGGRLLKVESGRLQKADLTERVCFVGGAAGLAEHRLDRAAMLDVP